MADRGKVIEGLECIMRSTPEDCVKVCGGAYKCARAVARDAVELLKEPEPEKLRLYTAEEMQHLPDRTTVCVERLISREDDERGYRTGCGWGVVWNRTGAEDGGVIHAGMLGSFLPNTITEIPFQAVESYGNGRITALYRFWTDRPTQEQSKAVKWDEAL